MFICNFCKKSVPCRTPCKKVVIQTVMYHHPHRPKVHRKWILDKQGKPRLDWLDDKGGIGPQIAVEVPACPTCGLEQELKREKRETEQLRLIG